METRKPKNKNRPTEQPQQTDPPTLSELLLQIPQDDQEFERLPLPERPLNTWL